MATKTNLFIDQGTTFITTVIAKYSNGDVIDLTGFTANSMIRKHYTSSNSVAFTSTVTTASAGEVTLSLTANASANLVAGRYVYDCEITQTSSGNVSRIAEGIVTVNPQVTR
jgi:hypothetical protein